MSPPVDLHNPKPQSMVSLSALCSTVLTILRQAPPQGTAVHSDSTPCSPAVPATCRQGAPRRSSIFSASLDNRKRNTALEGTVVQQRHFCIAHMPICKRRKYVQTKKFKARFLLCALQAIPPQLPYWCTTTIWPRMYNECLNTPTFDLILPDS